MRNKDESKRLRIQQACIDMVFDIGIEGVSAGKIAKNAEVSPASIYVYYENMIDMLQSINNDIIVHYFTEISKSLNLKKSVKDNFYALWNAAYVYCTINYKEFIFTSRISNTCVVDLKKKISIPEHHQSISGFLNQAIDEKKIKPLSVECFIYIAFTPFYGILKTNIENNVIHLEDDILNLLRLAAWDAIRL